jgi:hypothetical protein
MSEKDAAMTLAERIGELARTSAVSWPEAFGVVMGAAGLLDAARERDRLRAAVDAVLSLHQPYESNFVRLPTGISREEADRIYRETPKPTAIYCSTCMDGRWRVAYPCATVRALAPAKQEQRQEAS